MKSLIRIAALAATLLSAATCIYPYEVEIKQGSEWPLVVEGDILIGSRTTIILSRVEPFDATEYEVEPISARGYIEGEDGIRVQQDDLSHSDQLKAWLYFDTSTLRDDQRYRLHFDTFTAQGDVSNSFESGWLDVCPAPSIDALTYSKNEAYDELWIGLSMHCHGSHHFRWYFSEVWEYHSETNSHLRFNPQTRQVEKYAFREPDLYYCWQSGESSQINIFSTANQTEDRFEELAFHTIPLTDIRLQVMYKITVELQAMSEDAYNYWYNMQQNSEDQGSIFAPTPSEMASNIHCISDQAVQVMGYLNAAVPVKASMFYDNEENHFYKLGKPMLHDQHKVSASRPDSLAYWYNQGYLPFDELYEEPSFSPTHYLWDRAACIDCRLSGGTKTKPEGWPSDHY